MILAVVTSWAAACESVFDMSAKFDENDVATLAILLHKALACLADDFEQSYLRFNPQKLTVALLVATIYDLCESAILLIEAGKVRGLSPIERSAFEAMVHLRNVAKDPAYFGQIEAKYYQQNIKTLRKASESPDNPYLEGIHDKADLDEVINRRTAAYREKVSAGQKPLTIEDASTLANLKSEYDSIYALMAGDSHHELRALEQYHLRARQDGKSVIRFGGSERIKEHVEKISLVMMLIAECRRTLAQFGSGPPTTDAAFAQVAKEFSMIMERYFRSQSDQKRVEDSPPTAP